MIALVKAEWPQEPLRGKLELCGCQLVFTYVAAQTDVPPRRTVGPDWRPRGSGPQV